MFIGMLYVCEIVLPLAFILCCMKEALFTHLIMYSSYMSVGSHMDAFRLDSDES